jgi:MFS family permease
LSPPFYVLVAQQQADAGLLGLGALIIANGLAAGLSAPFWGYLGDRSSRSVMAIAAAGAGLLGIFTYTSVVLEWHVITSEFGMAVIFLLLNVMHGGVRLGRKVYLVDMANADNRAAYVAVSNSVIGVMMLAGGLIGLLAEQFGAVAIVLLLSVLSLLAALYILTLPQVSYR